MLGTIEGVDGDVSAGDGLGEPAQAVSTRLAVPTTARAVVRTRIMGPT